MGCGDSLSSSGKLPPPAAGTALMDSRRVVAKRLPRGDPLPLEQATLRLKFLFSNENLRSSPNQRFVEKTFHEKKHFFPTTTKKKNLLQKQTEDVKTQDGELIYALP